MVARTMAKVFDAKKIVTQPIAVENKPGGGQVTGTVTFAVKLLPPAVQVFEAFTASAVKLNPNRKSMPFWLNLVCQLKPVRASGPPRSASSVPQPLVAEAIVKAVKQVRRLRALVLVI